MIYFDNSATSYPKPEEVYQKMDEVNRTLAVNAGRGGYRLAVKAADIIEDTREKLASLVSFNNSNKVILMSSATCALNTVINSIEWSHMDTVYVSPFEHNSVLRPLEALKEIHGFTITRIPFSREKGTIELEKLDELFQQNKPKLVALTHASNVTGQILPVKEINCIAKEHGSITMVDGAQTLGYINVDLDDLNCDYYIFAGHKGLYGPFGTGGLFINSDEIMDPFLYGGTGNNSEELTMPEVYPGRLEAGSPNIVAIAGLNEGLKWLSERKDKIEKEQKLYLSLIEVLKNYPEITIIGENNHSNQIPVVSCVFDGYTPQEVSMILDQENNIATRAGLHCAPLTHKLFGTFPLGAVRFSLGYFSETHHLEKLDSALHALF